MSIDKLINSVKNHPDYHRVGMILCHNGVVRRTSRDGRPVKGLKVAVDHGGLDETIQSYEQRPGIVKIAVTIFEDRYLKVGDDVMYLVVAGDIRENVLETMKDLLNAIKTALTRKTEYYLETGD